MTTFTAQITASTDDAQQAGAAGLTCATGGTTITLDNVTSTPAPWGATRWLNVTVPNSPSVSACTVTYNIVLDNAGETFKFEFEKTATPATYASTSNNIGSRTYTGSTVTSTVNSTGSFTTPSLITPLNIVLTLAGWASGDNLAGAGHLGSQAGTITATAWDNSSSSTNTAQISITYTAGSPPGAPTGLTASYASATSVTLNWTQGSGTVTDNKVKYGTDGSTFGTTVDQGAAVTTATITGLTSGQLYFFEVDAENTNGASAYTGPVPWVCGSHWTGQVSASSDDAVQKAGTVTIADATDSIVQDYFGFRFLSALIANLPITSVALNLYFSAASSPSGSFVPYCQLSTAPATFAASSNNISSRTLTDPGSAVSLSAATTGWNKFALGLTPFVEVINQQAWASGDNLAVILNMIGPTGITVEMQDGSAVQAAILAIFTGTNLASAFTGIGQAGFSGQVAPQSILIGCAGSRASSY